MAKYFHFYDDACHKGDLEKGAIGVLFAGYDTSESSFYGVTAEGADHWMYADPVEIVPTHKLKAMRDRIAELEEALREAFNLTSRVMGEREELAKVVSNE